MNKKPTIIVADDESGTFIVCKPKHFLLMLLICLCSFGYSQTLTVKQADGTYSAQTKERAKTEAKNTGKLFKTSDGKTLPIFESKNGKFFVIRISKKTGAAYNQYITLN